VRHVPAPRRRRNKKTQFRIDHIRRREIERLARHVGAADTEDLDRFLIAWSWHNRQSNDPVWAITNAARRMGRPNLTDAEASAIIEEASTFRFAKYLTADGMAEFLGVTYAQRQHRLLRLTTIGSINVNRDARREIRKIRDKVQRRQKRRAAGVRPRAEWEANSIAAKARAGRVSRMTFYRRRKRAEQAKNHPDVTGVSAARLLISEDRPVTGLSERDFVPKEGKKKNRGLSSSRTATTPAADRDVTAYSSLPLELRLLALGLQSGGANE
jgi:hypothetical protein